MHHILALTDPCADHYRPITFVSESQTTLLTSPSPQSLVIGHNLLPRSQGNHDPYERSANYETEKTNAVGGYGPTHQREQVTYNAYLSNIVANRMFNLTGR